MWVFQKPNKGAEQELMQGCKAIICMPVLAPDIKVQAVKRLGGVVKLVGETYTECQQFAQVRHCKWMC